MLDKPGFGGNNLMETLYFANTFVDSIIIDQNICWLTVDDYDVFCEHLKLCGQYIIDRTKWERAYDDNTIYCGLFVGDKMVCRACVEKYSANAWEVGDVRTAEKYRGNGYAHQISSFVLKYIFQQGRTATIRTEEDNMAMKKVITDLGFSVL